MNQPGSLNTVPSGFAPSSLQLRRQLLWLLLARVVVLTLLLGISSLLLTKGQILILPPLSYMIYFTGAVYLITIVSAFILQKTEYLVLFAYLQAIFDTLIVSILVFFTGNSQSLFTVFYFFPVITGGFLLFSMGSLLMACLCTLSYAVILIIEYLGYYPAYFNNFRFEPITDYNMVLQHFAIPGLTFFLMAILTSMLAGRLRRTEAALSRAALDYDRLDVLNRQILNDITTGITTVDESGKITSFNRASEEITGYPAAEALGQPLQQIMPGLQEGDQVNAMRLTVDLPRKDCKKIPVGYSWARLNMPDGCNNCRVYTMQNLSQIKKMEAKVQQSEKMATIGEMAAGVAHEFRNPLAAISGAAQILRSEAPPTSTNQKLTNIIVRECDRLDGTIEEFLQFSKPSLPDREWFSLYEASQECVQMLEQKPDWNRSCKITNEIPEHIDVHGDHDQVEQVLINLISNGYAAMEGKEGCIRLTAKEESLKDGSECTIISVNNTGPPIPTKQMGKIFEPFFTTRENGTGLGLAIVRQIIERHDGAIYVTNLPHDEGVTFTITIPLP